MLTLKRIGAAAILSLALIGPAAAWEGYDQYTGYNATIEPGNLVRPGHDIEVYDWHTNRYHYMTVETMNRVGRDVDVEVFDWRTNEFRTFTFEGR